jgi:hypothetical protein
MTTEEAEPMFARNILLITLVIALGGCGGANLAKLKRDYDRAWNESPPRQDQLLAIADQAQAVADKEKDKRSALSALAMGGLAAVKAGPQGYEKAVNIGERGKRECQALPEEQFGAPRDCAVLSVVADLAKSEQLAERITKLKDRQDPTTSDLPESANDEVIALNSDLASAWTGFNEATEKALAMPEVDDSVKSYFSRQRLTAYCNYDTFLQIASNLPGTGAQPAAGFAASKESFCAIRSTAPSTLRDQRCPGKETRFSDRACG